MFEFVKESIWLIPALCLFAVAWQGFNTPPTNRDSTTFTLFYLGVLIYFALLMGIWAFVFVLLAKWGAADLVGNGFVLAVVAALMVVVASKFRAVKPLDVAARQFCVQFAAIPRLADQLGMDLGSRADFLVNTTLKPKISEVILKNIGRDALNFKNDGSPSSQFTRAVSLYWQFIVPHTKGVPLEFNTNPNGKAAYDRVMRLESKIVSQANLHYTSLMGIGLSYFTAARPVEELEDRLRSIARETSNFVCGLVARWVLLQDKTPMQRKKRISSIGFPSYDHLPPIVGVDQWVASVIVIAVMTLIVALFTRSNPISPTDAFLRAIEFAIQIGLSVLAGTLVASRFLQRHDGRGLRFPPIFELIIAALVIVAISAALKIFASLIPDIFTNNGFGFTHSINDFSIRWPGILFPFVSTISVGLLCSYLSPLGWRPLHLAILGAILNGFAFVIAACLFIFLVPNDVLANFGPDLTTARFKIMLASSIIGLAVGAMVLVMFRKPAVQNGSTQTHIPNWEQWEGNQTRGRWADPQLGEYSRASAEELEGRYVCFRPTFANPAIINAYLITIQWDVKQSCLTFEEKERVDFTYSQSGQISIPQGVPFINLVTMDKGDVRMITVSRPDKQGLARGLVLTLSHPRGMHFTPASAPVVLRRLGEQEQTPQLGFVHPGTPDYDLYRAQLGQVIPDYGILGKPFDSG